MPNAKFKIAFINNNNKHVSLPSSLNMGSLQGFACFSLYSEQCGMFPLCINVRNNSYVVGHGSSAHHTRQSFLIYDCVQTTCPFHRKSRGTVVFWKDLASQLV